MIELKGLEIRAGDLEVGPIDLSVPPGAYGVLLGPSGAGKSVVLEAVAGVREPHAGDVRVGGRSVVRLPPDARGVGLVFQDGLLFPHLSVAANIAYGVPRVRRGRPLGRRAAVRAEVRRWASALGVGGLLGRRVTTLSGGERQRVALARALAAGPEVLLLDEPLSALDGPARDELREVLRGLSAESGLSVLHVTHDLDEAASLARVCAVLGNGRLLQVGAPEEILRRPASVEVARITGAGNVLRIERTSDPLAVRLEGGILARLAAPCPDGGCYAVIRAHDIVVEPGPAAPHAACNEVDGIVRRVVSGATTTTLYVDSSPALVVSCGVATARQAPNTGDRVRLRFAPEAVHIVPSPPVG